jgi:hypothetical protein
MQSPTFWLHKDGSVDKAVTVLDELRCRRMLARPIQQWEYEACVVARELTISAELDGAPPPHFRGLPAP